MHMYIRIGNGMALNSLLIRTARGKAGWTMGIYSETKLGISHPNRRPGPGILIFQFSNDHHLADEHPTNDSELCATPFVNDARRLVGQKLDQAHVRIVTIITVQTS